MYQKLFAVTVTKFISYNVTYRSKMTSNQKSLVFRNSRTIIG